MPWKVGNSRDAMGGRCRTDQRWEWDMTRSELGRTGGAIQIAPHRRKGGVLVSARRRRACSTSIPYLCSPKLSAQLSPASFLLKSSSGSRSPCISHPVSLFLAPVAPFLPPSADRLEPFETVGWRVYPGWMFGGDRATRGRETLAKEGGWSRSGVS